MNYRLHKLGVTSDWQYRNFCIQIAERYRQSEPNGISRETSTVWDKVLGELRAEGISKANIATDLALPVFEVENLVFRLTNMQSIDGLGGNTNKITGHLKLV